MAKDLNFGVRGLTGRLGDIRRVNNFILHIEDVTDNSALNLVVQQAFIPQYQLEVLEFRRGTDVKKLAGVASWTGGNITILDTLSRDELEVLQDWAEKTYDPKTGKIGKAYDDGNIRGYKRSGSIVEYASDGTLSRSWPLEGMWISQIDYGSLDAAGNELKQISFTIQIDPPTTDGLRPTYGDGYEN